LSRAVSTWPSAWEAVLQAVKTRVAALGVTGGFRVVLAVLGSLSGPKGEGKKAGGEV